MTATYLRGQDLIDQIQQQDYSRDLIGYHGEPPKVEWPNGARVAVQFVLNYEEGGENHVEHGDAGSEQFCQILLARPVFQTNTCRWIPCTNMAHERAFGAFTKSLKNANSP